MGMKVKLVSPDPGGPHESDEGNVQVTSDGRIQLVCDQPAPILYCDSVAASRTKCGYQAFFTWPWGGVDNNCMVPFPDPADRQWYTERNSATPDSCTTCTGFDCNGGVGRVTTEFARFLTSTLRETGMGRPAWWPPEFMCDVECATQGTVTTIQSYNPDGCVLNPYTQTGSITCVDPDCGCDPSNPGCCTQSNGEFRCWNEVLSDEYTTTLLISNTEAGLPVYSNSWACASDECINTCNESYCPCGPFVEGQGCNCSASYNLSPDESSLTIKQFQYLFQVADTNDPPDNGCVLKWIEQFIADLTVDTWFEGNFYPAGSPDPDDTHWTKNKKSFTFDGEATQTDIFECKHPDSNGVITIQDIHW